jgi:hypothetical protein
VKDPDGNEWEVFVVKADTEPAPGKEEWLLRRMICAGASSPRRSRPRSSSPRIVGSGIMAERLAGGNVAVALLANALATGGALVALILTFGPISGRT